VKGSGRAAAIVLALLAAAGLLVWRGRLRELALRLRLAFLLVATVLCGSILVRGLQAEGDRRLYALVAFAIVAPCVALAWRDAFRSR
jgi:uncharacterized protein involved in response to NO